MRGFLTVNWKDTANRPHDMLAGNVMPFMTQTCVPIFRFENEEPMFGPEVEQLAQPGMLVRHIRSGELYVVLKDMELMRLPAQLITDEAYASFCRWLGQEDVKKEEQAA